MSCRLCSSAESIVSEVDSVCAASGTWKEQNDIGKKVKGGRDRKRKERRKGREKMEKGRRRGEKGRGEKERRKEKRKRDKRRGRDGRE